MAESGEAGGVRAWWSLSRTLKIAVSVFVVVHLVNSVVMVLNPSWRAHLTFSTDRTTVEVVDVEADATSCGRRDVSDRYVITWTDDDGEEQGGYVECVGPTEVGDRLTAYPVPDDRAYDWPTWEFYAFTVVGSLLAGAALSLLTGWSSRREEKTDPRGRGPAEPVAGP